MKIKGIDIENFNKSTEEIADLIDAWIFNEKHRAIMKRRLCDGVTFEPLAEEFGLSVQQIKNIVYKCQDKLFCHL